MLKFEQVYDEKCENDNCKNSLLLINTEVGAINRTVEKVFWCPACGTLTYKKYEKPSRINK